jgi:thiol-disulfide isomerase/thioredoxin
MNHHRAGARMAPWVLGTFLMTTAAAPRGHAEAPPAGGPEVGKVSLAGLRLQDLDGKTVELASYLGKGPVVLDFWATWCKPCLAALPELNMLYADLQPRGLELVGLNEDGPRNAAKVKPFVRTKGIKFPVLVDLNRDAQTRLNVQVLPTTLLLDSTGRVVHTTFGYRPGEIDQLRARIETLLDSGSRE